MKNIFILFNRIPVIHLTSRLRIHKHQLEFYNFQILLSCFILHANLLHDSLLISIHSYHSILIGDLLSFHWSGSV